MDGHKHYPLEGEIILNLKEIGETFLKEITGRAGLPGFVNVAAVFMMFLMARDLNSPNSLTSTLILRLEPSRATELGLKVGLGGYIMTVLVFAVCVIVLARSSASKDNRPGKQV